jgi:hypothetical protein
LGTSEQAARCVMTLSFRASSNNIMRNVKTMQFEYGYGKSWQVCA